MHCVKLSISPIKSSLQKNVDESWSRQAPKSPTVSCRLALRDRHAFDGMSKAWCGGHEHGGESDREQDASVIRAGRGVGQIQADRID
jgi:hypothetical protein